MSEARMTFDCGRLLCGQVRDYLRRAQVIDQRIRFSESSGWFVRTFTVVGPTESLRTLQATIERASAQNEVWS